MLRPRYRSAMARRVFFAVAACLLLLLLLLLAVAMVANGAIADPTRFSAAWFAKYTALLRPQVPLLAVALAVALLAALVLARWAVSPIDRLAAAAATLNDDPSTRLPTQAVGEVGAIARNFSELSDVLMRSSRELEKQNALMNASVTRLEQLLRLGYELSLMLDADQLMRRAANALHDVLGYERVGAALVEGEMLAFYLDDIGAAKEGSPLRAALSENSVSGRAALTGAAVRADDLRAGAKPGRFARYACRPRRASGAGDQRPPSVGRADGTE